MKGITTDIKTIIIRKTNESNGETKVIFDVII